MIKFKYRETVQALNIFAIKEGGSIDKRKALQLIFLLDKYYINNHCTLLTCSDYYVTNNLIISANTEDLLTFEITTKYKNNIVQKNDYEISYLNEFLFDFEGIFIVSKKDVNFKAISKTALNSINLIYDFYGKYSHSELEKIIINFDEVKKYCYFDIDKYSKGYNIDIVEFFHLHL